MEKILNRFLENLELQEIIDDFPVIWDFYKTVTKLYLQSVKRKAPNWIKKCTEYGMSKYEIQAHQLISRESLQPVACRIDYVTLGAKRKIAEIQWKSGGPGLFFGIQDTYADIIACQSDPQPLNRAVNNFYNLLVNTTNDKHSAIINAVRNVWFNGEKFIKKDYSKRGLHYFPLDREKLAERLIRKRDKYFISDEKGFSYKVDFINGQGFTQFFPKNSIVDLAKASIERKLWIETPLNYLYRQKWMLALPFMPEYQDFFDNRLRKILIPTALIQKENIDLSPIIPYIDHILKEKILSIKKLEQLAELPSSLRETLVFKCAAGIGKYYSDGKGVFRITGSKLFAEKVLNFIEERLLLNEPWIVQTYINKKYKIPVSLPWSLEKQSMINAHARFMIYAGKIGKSKPDIIGGLGNFGVHWKVSGKTPSEDKYGNILGTAFNDIRINKNTYN